MSKIFATIITIGDELLIGQVIDTNSAYMAQALNKIGILIKHRIAIVDDEQEIIYALNEAFKSSHIILITGGLGPTADDITKQSLCNYFGGKMILHSPTLEHVKYLFENVFKRPMIERNIQQAEVPDNCTVLKNEIGTAPALMFEKENKICIAMPGVPYEMKWIMQEHVLNIIQQKFDTGFVEHKTLLTACIGESFLAELIKDWENNLPSDIKLAYLPKFGMVRLRLSSFGKDKNILQQKLSTEFEKLKLLVKDYLVVDEDLPIELVISLLLKKQNKTLSTAESCTGGSIASIITSHAGASEIFKGSVVSYSNSAKHKILNVPNEILQTKGAVSQETVEFMVKNCMELFNTNYAIAVSGIMGPSGATEDKPLGLVWISVANEQKIISKQFQFKYDRERNIQHTIITALNMLRKLIVEDNIG